MADSPLPTLGKLKARMAVLPILIALQNLAFGDPASQTAARKCLTLPMDHKTGSVPKIHNHCGVPFRLETATLRYKLARSGGRMKLEIAASQEVGPVVMRLGPFEQQPGAARVLVNGKCPGNTVEQSGDSWWVRFSLASVPHGRTAI